MEFIHPFMLVDGDREAMEFRYDPGTYNVGLAAALQYVEGDLVEVVAGMVQKSNRADGALITPLFLAGADWDQPYALPYFLERGVPLNVIPKKNLWVFTYQGNSGDAVRHPFIAADREAVLGQALRELRYNAAEGCYTVRANAAAPNVQLVGLFRGDVGDTNARVIARILDTSLGS